MDNSAESDEVFKNALTAKEAFDISLKRERERENEEIEDLLRRIKNSAEKHGDNSVIHSFGSCDRITDYQAQVLRSLGYSVCEHFVRYEYIISW